MREIVMGVGRNTFLGAIAVFWASAVGTVCAQSENVMPNEAVVPPTAESRILHESFWYSSYADRSWVVGYAPKKTSLFLNPREYLSAVQGPTMWRNAYAGTFEGYCLTTYGSRPSGTPSDSPALAYHYGQLGITSHLSAGYPEGKRVVEPIIVPHQSSWRPGGVLIVGAPTTITFAPECEPQQPKSERSRPVVQPLEK
jgi:hypothetical protein